MTDDPGSPQVHLAPPEHVAPSDSNGEPPSSDTGRLPQAQGGQTSLAALSDAWGRFGCAICSHVPSVFAQPGARIELHHILPRSQGGTDDPDNLMGLCGELCPEKCHWKVTNEIIKIRWAENINGWVALDEHGTHH